MSPRFLRACVLGFTALVMSNGCVEQAYDYWTRNHDAGAVDGGATDAGADSGPAVDAGPSDGGADAGASDAGLDGGSVDAGNDAGPQDGGTDAGCASWSDFIQAAGARTLCVGGGGTGQLSLIAFHGPATGFNGSSIAYASGGNLGLAIALDGGVQLLQSFDAGEPITSLVVSDEHDYVYTGPGPATNCVNAIFTLADGDAGYLNSCDPFNVGNGGLLTGAPRAPLNGMSWIPSLTNQLHALGVASISTASFYFEGTPNTGTPLPNQNIAAVQVQGVPSSSYPPNDSCNPSLDAGSWWIYLPNNYQLLWAVSHCVQTAPVGIFIPGLPSLPGDLQLTASLGGGVVAVGSDGGSLVAFDLDSSLTVSSLDFLDAGMASIGSLHIARWGPSGVVRAAFVDPSGVPYFADLFPSEVSHTVGWLGPVSPAPGAGPGAVFVAPMFPNMLLRMDDGGTTSIGYLP